MRLENFLSSSSRANLRRIVEILESSGSPMKFCKNSAENRIIKKSENEKLQDRAFIKESFQIKLKKPSVVEGLRHELQGGELKGEHELPGWSPDLAGLLVFQAGN